MQKYSSTWSQDAWEEAYARALAYVFELPHARTVGPAESQDLVRAIPWPARNVSSMNACYDTEDGIRKRIAGDGPLKLIKECLL
jgi:hypothetical protein